MGYVKLRKWIRWCRCARWSELFLRLRARRIWRNLAHLLQEPPAGAPHSSVSISLFFFLCASLLGLQGGSGGGVYPWYPPPTSSPRGGGHFYALWLSSKNFKARRINACIRAFWCVSLITITRSLRHPRLLLHFSALASMPLTFDAARAPVPSILNTKCDE